MTKVRKQFSPALYEAYDQPAKVALIKILQSQGHDIVAAKEDYYADIKSTKNGVDYFNEAEVKLGWGGEWNTTWTEIRIPERKARLLEKYREVNGVLNFYIFRKDFKQAWRIKDSQLTKESLREAKGRYIKKGEQFFHIPYTEAELIEVD